MVANCEFSTALFRFSGIIVLLLFFSGFSYSEEEKEKLHIWVQGVFSEEVTEYKLRPFLNPLSEIISRELIVKSTHSKTLLLEKTMGDKVDVILWGGDPVLTEELLNLGFRVLAFSYVEVHLYRAVETGKPNIQPLKEKKKLSIGLMSNSAALDVIQKYYSSIETEVTIKQYSNYLDIMKAVSNNDVDFIAAGSAFLISLRKNMENKFQSVYVFPGAGKILLFSRSEDKKIDRLLQDYFVNGSGKIFETFGLGDFRKQSRD